MCTNMHTQTNSGLVKLFRCIKNNIMTFTFVNEMCAETFQGFLTGSGFLLLHS